MGISTLILLAGCHVARTSIQPALWTPHQFIAPDGSAFPYTRWMPAVPPRAVIIALHGLGGAASDWRPLGETFPDRGVAVYAPELRGMGNDPDPSRVGHLDRSRGWLDDFTSFALRVQATHPELPIFWYGESLGGLITTRLLYQRETIPELRVAGFILASPIVRVRGKLPPWKTWLLRVGACVSPRARIDLQSLAPPDQPAPQVVSTTTHADQLSRTPHAVTRFSLRLLDEIRRYVSDNEEPAELGGLPVLVLHGGQDLFSSPDEVSAYFESIRSSRKERVFFPSGYHLLLHDDGRERVLAAIDAWLTGILESSRDTRQGPRSGK